MGASSLSAKDYKDRAGRSQGLYDKYTPNGRAYLRSKVAKLAVRSSQGVPSA
jgi:hypothetical protein